MGEKPKSNTEEIAREDLEIDYLSAMLGDDEEDEDEDKADDAAGMLALVNAADASEAKGDGEGRCRDYKVDLFAYAHPVAYYTPILSELAAADKVDAVVILTTTAHPSSWYAGKKACPNAFVLLERVSSHCRKHGEEILLKMHLRDELKTVSRRSLPRGAAGAKEELIACTEIPVEDQLLSAYEVGPTTIR